MRRIKKNTIMLIAMLLPSFAFAANLFDLPSGDVSLKVLGAIFGGLMDSNSGGGMNADPLLAGIKMFNGGCLIIGGILAGYTILAGTLNTAHDGEMLGKKFSSVWIPIRYSVGTALVLPVVGGGYCVMQAIVMWLVIQGIGLADSVWSGFMNNPTAAANTNIANTRELVLGVAQDAFKSSICWRSYDRTINESHKILNWVSEYKYSMRPTADGYEYGDATSTFKKDGCGKVLYPQNKDYVAPNNIPTINSGYLGDIGTIFAPIDISAINNAQNKQTDILVDKMDKLAAKVIATAKNGDGVSLTPDQEKQYYQEILTATDNYTTKIKTAANSLSNQDAFGAIKQTASNQGWILAGAWFTRIVQMNDRINKAAASAATSDTDSPGTFSVDAHLFSDATKYLKGADQVLSVGGAPSDIYNTQSQEEKTKSGGQSTSDSNWWKKAESAITKSLTGINLYELKNDPRHPLIIVNELGNRLVNLSVSVMAGLLSILAVSGIAAIATRSTGLLSAVVGVMGWFVDMPIKLLMGVGMGTAYILPNMPFIIWIGAIVGWVLLVIEAIIAAPLWAIMHLHPNGEDLTGRAGNGYSLVLSLLLRPVLMVFGVEASIVISSVIGEFINKTFFEVFAQSTGGFTGFSALIGLAMGTMLYFIVMFIFIKKCFGLMFQLPDQLLQWIGGPTGASLGQFAGEFSQAADKGASAGAAAGGFLASSVAKGGAALGKKLGEHAHRGKQEADQEKATDDKNLDGAAGKGASAFRDKLGGMDGKFNPNAMFKDNFSGNKKAMATREAYDQSLMGVVGTDAEYGRGDFESAVSEAHSNGFKDYNNDPIQAFQDIGQKLMERNLGNSQFGNFAVPAAKNSEGKIDGKRSRSVLGTVGRMASRIGPQATKEILDRAVDTGATGQALVSQAETFYKEFLDKPIEETPPPSGGVEDGNK